jgi:hypothetical protein
MMANIARVVLAGVALSGLCFATHAFARGGGGGGGGGGRGGPRPDLSGGISR